MVVNLTTILSAALALDGFVLHFVGKSLLAGADRLPEEVDLDYYDIEWFALEMNRDHPVVFEIASKNCILDSFVDYNDYYISSRGFLTQ